MMENLGGAELMVILLVVLIFFGPRKIPELAASLGKGLRKFNDAKEGIESQIKTTMREPLEAISGAREGLEKKLMDASQPLREVMVPPSLSSVVTKDPGPVPAIAPPEGALPRGAELLTEGTTTAPTPPDGASGESAATQEAAARPEASTTEIPKHEA